jgi:hypothetical protein
MDRDMASRCDANAAPTSDLSSSVRRVPGASGKGRNGRVVFAAAWIASQIALVSTSGRRPDHIFGYRMFPEASTIEIHLWRDTAGGPVRAPGGEWSARDAGGQLRHFSWRDRVRDPVLASIDARVFASYGVDAQLARLGHALDDAIDHLDEDADTRRLRAEVVVWRNGRAPTTVTLESRWREKHGPGEMRDPHERVRP